MPSQQPQSPSRPAHEGATDKPLRADARRNRARLLGAAQEVFSERGADASMDDVAKRAKVGIGTLYRHFPTREALLAGLVADGLGDLLSRAETRSASRSPLAALEKFLEELVVQASAYRGLAASLGIVLDGGGACASTTETGKRLLERAQSAGEVRRNVDFSDVVCMITGISLAVQQDAADTTRARRLVGILIDGLRVPSARRGSRMGSRTKAKRVGAG